MRRVTLLLSAVLCVLMRSTAIAQTTPPWTGVAVDEARPDTAGFGSGSVEMSSRSLSADGRYVVFFSDLPHLVPDDTNNRTDVFLRDRLTGELRRVSVASDGSQANDYSAWATISSDGRHIAFHSCAANLDPADTNDSCDLFIHDRTLGTTVRANIGPFDEQATYSTQHHFNLSADGRYFVFVASFDGGFPLQLWLRDRDLDGNGVFDEPGTAVTTRISQDYVGTEWLYQWDDVAISHDGRWIAYSAQASDSSGNPLGTRLYLHDRVTITTARVDRPVGADSPAFSGTPDFSESGLLVYTSNADLTEGDGDGTEDVFVFNVVTGGHVAVELTHPGAPALDYEWSPAISADGRYVTFTGASYDLWNFNYNVYAVDRQTGQSYELSVWPDGTRDNRAGPPSISADGSAIAFAAGAGMLVNGCCTSGAFVATGVALSPAEITVPASGGTFTIDVTMPAGIPWSLNTAGAAGSEFSQTSGVGSAPITVTVWPNYDGQERELSFWLGSEQVRLQQGVAPFINFVYPSSGPPGGGTSITLFGQGFVDGATVSFDGVEGTEVAVVDSYMINVVTPAHAIGVARLTVTNPSGDFYDYYFFYHDDTPPVVTPALSGTLGQNGWYTSDVTLSWNYEDPDTTVFLLNCVNPYVHTMDVVSYLALCHVMSEGGDTIGEVEIKRDTVPPIVAISPSAVEVPETFFQGQVVPLAHYCSDATSGIATCTLSQSGPNVDTSAVGTFVITLTGVDFAGHSATASTPYHVKAATAFVVPSATGVYGGTSTLRATLLGTGVPLAGKTITFFVDNAPVGAAITSATGEAVLNLALDGRGAGQHEMHVEFAGDGTAFPSIASSELVIFKATPVVTWATPAPITQGAPLGSTELNATASVPGAFIYEPGFWAVLPPGTHTLTASFSPQDGANYEAVVKTVTLKVKAIPVITWPAPASITYPMSLTGTQLSATANVAGSFVYAPPFGTLLDAGTHTLYVTFTPTNTADYVSESATVTIEVLKGTVTINWPYFEPIRYPTPLTGLQLNAEVLAGGSITYSPPYGTVLNAGTHTLTATFSPDYPYNYHPATTTREILVGKAYPVVYWQGDLAPIVHGTPLGAAQLYATSPNAGTITYDPPAGTVLDAGLRIVRMTFTPDDTANYHTVTYQKEIAVDKQTTTVTWNTPAPIVYGTSLGATQLNATGSQPGSFSYDPPAGTVLDAGTHSLRVYFAPDSPNYYGGSWYVTLVVEKRTPVITWSNPAPITYGTALTWTQLNATKDVGGGSLLYSPPYGTVLSAGAGQTLTVTYEPAWGQWNNYHPASAAVTIDVQQLTPVINWLPMATITYGTPLGASQLNATSSLGGSFAYSPAAGTILPAGSHVVTGTFTPTDTVNHATTVATRTIVVDKAMPVVAWAAPADITYGTPLSPAQLSATADVPGTFTYSPPAGAILDAGGQTITAQFTADDQANYLPVSTARAINVLPAAPVVTWPAPQPIVYGTPISEAQLNATANVAGTFTYSHAPGLVLPAGSHTITALFSSESSNYHGMTATVELVVEKAMPVVTWPAPDPITYGTALIAAINATANAAGSFTYSPAPGTVLAAGTHQLTATFSPSNPNNYFGTTVHVSIEVTKAIPAITWANPASITYGTGLSGTQLNATANVNGSFVYTVPAASELDAGTHELSVTFTPADGSNYTTASRSVSIVITPAALTVQTNNAGKVYGEALPPFAATGTGFVNGDSMASLGGALAFATSATATSAPGSYAVTPSGVSSPNYSITFAAGTLTVTKAATALTLTTTPNPSHNNQTVQIRAEVAAVAPGAGTASGTVEFREDGTLLGTATLVNGVAAMNKNFKKGTHPLTATYAGDVNFTGSSGAVTHRTP